MSREASAAFRAPYPGAMGAQENEDPSRVGPVSVAGVVVAKDVVKAATAPPTPAKPRRALQSIDCNSAPQPTASRASCSPSRAPVKPAKRLPVALRGGEHKTYAVQKRPRAVEEAAGKLAPPVGAATAALQSPARVEGDVVESVEALESENLAWMDMMLALLEKKYGPHHAMPMSLARLEDGSLLQPRAKKRRTEEGDAEEPAVRNRNPLAAAPALQTRGLNTGDAATPALKVRAEASRLALEREEKEREERRRRMLLRHAQQIQDSSMRSSTSCGCKKGCLKMYCVCFSSRGFCHSGCSCDDCKNSRSSKEQRLEAIQSYLANDPRAFAYSTQQQQHSTSATGFLQLLPQKSNAVVQRGCRCKKSKCLKKYCECFQNGIACTAHCRCVDCSNHSEAALRFPLGAMAPKHSAMSAASPTAPFHPIQVTVTKLPKRNHVRKSIRLSL